MEAEAGASIIVVVLLLIFSLLMWIVPMALGIVSMVFFILALIDVTKREWPEKTTWLLIVILVPFGALIYWFSERKKLDRMGILPNNPSQQPPAQPPANN